MRLNAFQPAKCFLSYLAFHHVHLKYFLYNQYPWNNMLIPRIYCEQVQVIIKNHGKNITKCLFCLCSSHLRSMEQSRYFINVRYVANASKSESL